MIKCIIQQISQEQNKAVMVGTVSFLEMKGKVRLSYRKFSTLQMEEYQRRTDPRRVKQIAQFIRNGICANKSGQFVPLFPTSVILACSMEEGEFASLKVGEIAHFNVPNDTMIVDGQHRFCAFESLYKQVVDSFNEDDKAIKNFIESYSFNCCVLLNFDIWEQAEVFASVNFNQKKVNKSLFYDIYGIQLPDGDFERIPRQNEIYIAHRLISYLDSNKNSPFHGFVKMLGTGRGYVSQAFLVEALLKNFSPTGIWKDAVESLKKKTIDYMYVAYELSAYLAAVRGNFKDWWPEEVGGKPKSLLCKTTGVGAILMFLTTLHNKMEDELKEKLKTAKFNPLYYAEVIVFFDKQLSPLKGHGNELFSLTSSFSGGAGDGMQKKLYNRMLQIWMSENN